MDTKGNNLKTKSRYITSAKVLTIMVTGGEGGGETSPTIDPTVITNLAYRLIYCHFVQSKPFKRCYVNTGIYRM